MKRHFFKLTVIITAIVLSLNTVSADILCPVSKVKDPEITIVYICTYLIGQTILWAEGRKCYRQILTVHGLFKHLEADIKTIQKDLGKKNISVSYNKFANEATLTVDKIRICFHRINECRDVLDPLHPVTIPIRDTDICISVSLRTSAHNIEMTAEHGRELFCARYRSILKDFATTGFGEEDPLEFLELLENEENLLRLKAIQLEDSTLDKEVKARINTICELMTAVLTETEEQKKKKKKENKPSASVCLCNYLRDIRYGREQIPARPIPPAEKPKAEPKPPPAPPIAPRKENKVEQIRPMSGERFAEILKYLSELYYQCNCKIDVLELCLDISFYIKRFPERWSEILAKHPDYKPIEFTEEEIWFVLNSPEFKRIIAGRALAVSA